MPASAKVSPPQWLTDWLWVYALCAGAAFAAVHQLLKLGDPAEYSGEVVARLGTSITLGWTAGGVLLTLLIRAVTGRRGVDLVRRVPDVLKVAATVGGVLVVALTGVVETTHSRESTGGATFHPTANHAGGGREEVELPLPSGWRAAYVYRNDWSSARISDERGEFAFNVVVDLRRRDVGSKVSLANHVQTWIEQLQRAGTRPVCAPRTTPGGEGWYCRTSGLAGMGREDPWVHFTHFESWQGWLLTVEMRSPAFRAERLEPIARASIDGVQLRNR